MTVSHPDEPRPASPPRSTVNDTTERPTGPELGTPAAAILSAARDLFAEHGFAGTSTRSIAELAGVNLAMIHYYFGNKEQLYRQVVEQEFASLFGVIRKTAAAKPSVADFLAEMPAQILTMHREHPQLRQLVLREMADGAPRLPAMIREMGAEGPLGLHAFLTSYVAEATDPGIAFPTAQFLALIFAMGHGLVAFAPLLAEVFGVDPREPETADAVGHLAATVVRRNLAEGYKE